MIYNSRIREQNYGNNGGLKIQNLEHLRKSGKDKPGYKALLSRDLRKTKTPLFYNDRRKPLTHAPSGIHQKITSAKSTNKQWIQNVIINHPQKNLPEKDLHMQDNMLIFAEALATMPPDNFPYWMAATVIFIPI